MTFPIPTADNQFHIEGEQAFVSKGGKWRQHAGVYEIHKTFSDNMSTNYFTFSDYPDVPAPQTFVEARICIHVSAPGTRLHFDLVNAAGNFDFFDANDAWDFHGAMYSAGSAWGRINWFSINTPDVNGMALNWGDGGWALAVDSLAVAVINIHKLNASVSVLSWRLTHRKGNQIVTVKGRGDIKMIPSDIRQMQFWPMGGHNGASMHVRCA